MNRRTSALMGLLILVVIGGALAIGLSGSRPNASGCVSTSALTTHHVVIQNDAASPADTKGKLCDTVVITNRDPIAREIAFGSHDNHVPYDGVAEKVLNKDQSLTITLNQTGMFHFHDHLHDEVEGYLTVTK